MKLLLGVVYYEPAWAYGGPPRMVFDLARELVRRGHEVTVCTTDALDKGKRVEKLEEVSHGVRIVRFRNLSNRLAFDVKIFLPLGMRKWLYEHVREFDAVHLFDARTMLNAWASDAAAQSKVPFFVSAWGSLPRGDGWKAAIKQQYDRAYGPVQFGRAAGLLAQNDHEAALYSEYGGDAEKTAIWPLGVDPEEFSNLPAPGAFRARVGISAQDPLVLFVGRISELKGLDPLLRAFSAALKRVPHARLAVVGRDDGYLSRMLALAGELDIAKRVHFVGPLYGSDVIPAYVDCDLFSITPTHFEETSLASLAACAVGRAVLINDRCGVPWLDDYGAGRCVPHSVFELGRIMGDLLSDRPSLIKMGENARRMVEERFLLPRVVDQAELLYRRAADKHSLQEALMSTPSFFDGQHTSDQLPLPIWFRALRRWEVTRVQVASGLLPKGESLLDLGCGDGDLVLEVGERYQRIVATDVSAAALAQGKARTEASSFGDRIDWQVVDGNQALPFSDGQFDTVVSLSTLQYIFDPELLLAETFRVLRPGGHLLVEVPNVAYLPQRLRLLAGKPIQTSYWKHGIDGGNLHYFTVATLQQLVKQAGFTTLRQTGSGVFAAARTWRVSLLCGNVFLLARRPD